VQEYTDDVHTYPNIPGTILSWKAAKALAILPEHYPQPSPLPVVGNSVVHEWLELAGGMKVVACTFNCGGCLRATGSGLGCG